MTLQTTIALARMAFLSFLAESPLILFLAGGHPAHVAAIVLAGSLLVAAPPGIAVARAVQAGSEDGLAARYRESECLFVLAAAASQVGVIMAATGRGAVGPIGAVVAAGGTLAILQLILKSSTA